jgi:hypothetical protein
MSGDFTQYVMREKQADDPSARRIAELEAEVAALRNALGELIRVIETDDVPGYIYDATWAECGYCGKDAPTTVEIQHEADCFQDALDAARAAMERRA